MDETNVSPKHDDKIKFLVYGGLIISSDQMLEIDEGINKIRQAAGYATNDSLKFDSQSRPKNITPQKFAEVKNEVITLCINTKCKFLSYVVLHKIAETQDIAKTIKWGADHITGKFNYFLSENHSKGIVVMDRLPDKGEYKFLKEKFTQGLILKDRIMPLSNIRMFASSCDNASNFSSAMDIVLGSFRYCINHPPSQGPAKTMMKNITSLLWAEFTTESINPYEKGLTFRPDPSKIKSSKYRKEYMDLIEKLNILLS